MVKLMGLPSGDPRPPLPNIEGEKLKQLIEVINRFQLREKYGLGQDPLAEAGGGNKSACFSQAAGEMKGNT
jgi:hypothetical protein